MAVRTGAALATWLPRGGRAEAVTGGVRPVPMGWLVWATFLGFWIDPVLNGLPNASAEAGGIGGTTAHECRNGRHGTDLNGDPAVTGRQQLTHQRVIHSTQAQ